MHHRNVVIGSGPAGVSAAVALLQRGEEVLMLDGGQDLEKARQEKLVTLSQTPLTEWPGSAGSFLRDGMESSAEGIPLKLSYGSDFPYRSAPGAPQISGDGVNTKLSLGKGGFSAVWGSAIMPYRQADIEDWPITANDLAPHYKQVLEFMPVAQGRDALAQEFPLYKDTEAMPLSAQAQVLELQLEKNASVLNGSGVHFGRSRLAVDRHGVKSIGPCVLCGLCMYGCPYSLIYSTAKTVDELVGEPGFIYAPGHVANRVEEAANRVSVHTVDAAGRVQKMTSDRMFLAAGVLSTATIMLRSLGWFGRQVEFKDSHYFLLPMLRVRPVPGFERRNIQTLSQLFFEILDSSISPYAVHLQTYTYNDLFESAIRGILRGASAFFPWDAFLSRLYLIQGYLHSAHSPSLTGILEKNADGSDTLQLRSQVNTETGVVLKRVIRKLQQVRKQTGIRPLTPLLRQGDPGRGFHTGGSFPMSSHPTGMMSDIHGRVAGMQRTYIVDASVLPTIPATTITYTVMANAHRIASIAAN